MKRTLLLIFILFSIIVSAQKNYAENDFRPPLDIPIMLAGTFGELRSNHFHSGIDIKTQQREGLPIYAIGDGTVTRIKVSLWGYGKVIYVNHPNGYTSVYGHLKKFSPEIEKYIKKSQYKKQSYEIQVFPNYGELKVKKGEIIAYSGNTGGSSGPHLHFEIRNSITQKPMNPLLHGLEVRDAINPILDKIYAYPLSKDAIINQCNDKVSLHFSRQKDGTFLADKTLAFGTIGIGFVGYDRQDFSANKNGIYAVKLLVNGEIYVDYNFDYFSFSETRYINTLIDYSHYEKYKQRIQRCFKTQGNKLELYNTLKNNGKINIKDSLLYQIELLIEDFEGNLTKAIIPVKGKKETLKVKKENPKTENYIIAKNNNNYDLGAAKVYFPSNTFYNNFYIDLKKDNDTVIIHNNSVPTHRKFTINFDVSKFSMEEQKQLFIARLDKDMNPNYVTTYKRENTFSTKTRNLGIYTLVKDSLAPDVKTKNFKPKKWLNNYKYLSLKISDDLSGINTYSATLNGKWILMEYEPKTKTLTYNFDDAILKEKQHSLEVIVTDNVGNRKIFNTIFYRN